MAKSAGYVLETDTVIKLINAMKTRVPYAVVCAMYNVSSLKMQYAI